MKLSVALANTKPGTSKTTSSVMLAYALHGMGHNVLLADTDPAASALEWNDNATFPFDVAGLTAKNPGPKLSAYAGDDTVVVVDTPQAEDHGRAVRSVLSVVDELVIPVAPSLIEVERTSAMAETIEEAEDHRTEGGLRISVLLTRVVAAARSGPEVREALTSAGYDVLTSEIPRWETYAMAYGAPPEKAALAPFEKLAAELLERGGVA